LVSCGKPRIDRQNLGYWPDLDLDPAGSTISLADAQSALFRMLDRFVTSRMPEHVHELVIKVPIKKGAWAGFQTASR